MLLAIDIGNTNTNFGFFKGEKLVASFRAATSHARTSDEAAMLVSQFVQTKKLRAVENIVVATVVPKLELVYRQMAKDYYQSEALFVSSELKLNIKLDYPTPAEIGADRICNSVAAYDRFGGPAIIVDFGTATTFDVINEKGAYIGGVISPGVETSQSALAHRAAQLFKTSFEQPKQVVGKSTEDALKAGFFLGAVGQIDYIISSIIEECGFDPQVIATGGLAGAITPASRYISEVLPDITLDGLRIIHNLNSP